MSRDGNGRFTRGNPGGPGRPPRTTEKEYMRALSAACSLQDWTEIARTAVEKAKAGDARAREWLSRFLVGTPDQAAVALSTLAFEDEAGTEPYDVDAEVVHLRLLTGL